MSTQREARLLQLFRGAGATDTFAATLAQAFSASGLALADAAEGELVTRWVDVNERPVPPDADTIIRTITRTRDGVSESFTYWLDGLRAPRLP
jgi:hypothetical protein